MVSERKKLKKKVELSWTDDDLQLLLPATLDYKAKCEFTAENWETKRQTNKYIFDLLMKEYTYEKEKYPNKEKMNKEQVAAKLKIYNLGL